MSTNVEIDVIKENLVHSENFENTTRNSQKLQIGEQWQKEHRQKEKQWSTNTVQYITDLANTK